MGKTIRKWEAQGWTIAKTKNSHLKLTHPLAASPIFTSSTPSCPRSNLNCEAQMRRAIRGNTQHA